MNNDVGDEAEEAYVAGGEEDGQGWEYVDGLEGAGEDGLAYYQAEDGFWYAYDPNAVDEEDAGEGVAEEEADAVPVEVKAPQEETQPTASLPQPVTASDEASPALHAVPIREEYGINPQPPTSTFQGGVGGWIEDLFFSPFFRVYLSVMIYCAAVLIVALSVEYTFAALVRLFSPPSPKANPHLESFAYLAIFFIFSFIAVTVFGVISDMVKILWTQKRSDKCFWGMRNVFIYENYPPVIIYLLVIFVTLVLPFFWGFIETIVAKESIVFMLQRFSNVAVLASVILVCLCYIYFYFRAIRLKSSSLDRRTERDDFVLRQNAYKKEPMKMVKTHWYHASTVLEEFGFDRETLFYNPVVLIVGLTPLLGIYTAQALCTFSGDPNVVGGLIGSIGITLVIVLAWLTRLERKGQWSAYFTAFLIILLGVLGVVGGAVSAKPGSAAVVLVLLVVAQGMITRKRHHRLTARELDMLLSGVSDEEEQRIRDDEPTPHLCDTYLCCCKSVAEDVLSCFCDVSGIFKRRHAKVRAAERQYARTRLTLRTDQKTLLIWWIFVMIVVAGAVGLGNAVQYNYPNTIAVNVTSTAMHMVDGGIADSTSSLDDWSTASSADSPTQSAVDGIPTDDINLCNLTFNTDAQSPLTLLDLAFLAMLSYTYGPNGDSDFAAWFGDRRNFFRIYPERLPPTRDYATDGMSVQFSDYVDVDTGFHVITLNSNTRGLGMFRNIDYWGSVMAFQVAKALAPLISLWPDRYIKSFVQISDVYHHWFAPYSSLDNVTSYISNLIQEGEITNVLVVGDAFNGGYAKFLSYSLSVRFVAFNPPGTKFTVSDFEVNGTQVISSRSLWSAIDSMEDTALTMMFPCPDSLSLTQCSRITTTISYLLEKCGDARGRSFS